MRWQSFLLLAAGLALAGSAAILLTKTDTHKPFVASEKWQTIEEGQVIPAGLEVQIDMQTGVKRARLIPPQERTGVLSLSEKRDATLAAVASRLEAALAETADAGAAADVTPAEPRVVDMAEAARAAKAEARAAKRAADAAALVAAFGRWMSAAMDPARPESERLAGLSELEEEIRDADAGQDFVAHGGLHSLHTLLTNDTSATLDIRLAAMAAITAAASNNPAVQAAAGDVPGLVDALAGMIASASSPAEARRAIMALGALWRGHLTGAATAAQQPSLAAVAAAALADPRKTAVRALTLLTDLAEEQALVLADADAATDAEGDSSSSDDNDTALLQRARAHVAATAIVSALGGPANGPWGAALARWLPGLETHRSQADALLRAAGVLLPLCAADDARAVQAAVAAAAQAWAASTDEYDRELAARARLIVSFAEAAPQQQQQQHHHQTTDL